MKIVIDLVGDSDDVVEKDVEDVPDLEKRREAYLKWLRHNEQVLPQVVPVAPTRES